jgi:hypothetical protein
VGRNGRELTGKGLLHGDGGRSGEDAGAGPEEGSRRPTKGSVSCTEHGRSHWQSHRGRTEVAGGRHQWLFMVKKKAAVDEDVVVALLGSVTGHA